jgi:hypothetical protein
MSMPFPKGYSTLPAGAHVRTIFAGFGVSGSLLAAVGAVFVVAGSVLGFDQWPAELADPPASSVAIAPAGASAGAPAPETIALPAAAPAGPGTPGAGAGNGTTARPGGPARPAPPRTDPVPATSPAGPSVPAPADGAPTGPPDTTLATAVESTTGATADTVRSVGGAVPVAAPVTDLVGGLVDQGGQSVGGLLRGLAG